MKKAVVNLKRIYLFRLLAMLACLSAGITLSAQSQVQLSVKDGESGEQLAFVFVKALHSTQGYFTDLDGNVEVSISPSGDSVSFVLMGYKSQTLFIKSGMIEKTPVLLSPEAVGISDVVILPGINPAMRIMENAVRNRQENNLFRRAGYHYQSFNKLRLFPDDVSRLADTSLLRRIDLFLTETATDVWTLPAGKRFELVKASKISGYPGKAMPLSAGDLQSVTPYENYLSVVNEPFLSPVSPLGLDRYVFEWTDTFFTGADSIFEIHFVPRKGDWNAMEGILHIHSRHFAVVNLDVELRVRETSLLLKSGSIRQQYQSYADSLWIPVHLFAELKLLPVGKNSSMTLALSGRSDIAGFSAGSPPHRPSGVETEVATTAGSNTDSLRVNPLTDREVRTYRFLDSLGKQSNLPWMFDQIYNIQENRVGLGPVSFDLNRFFTSNRVENGRYGLGLWTNEKISRRISLGGWAMYGQEKKKDLDTRLKYGGELRVTPLANNNLMLGVGFCHDLAETGMQRLGHPPGNPLWRGLSREQDARNWLLTWMDYQDRRFAFAAVELPAHLSLRADYSESHLVPAFHYTFRGDSVFDAEDMSLVLRWGPGEKWIQQNGHKLLQENHLPVILLRWGRGQVTGQQNWKEQYDLAEVTVAHTFLGPWRMGISYRLQAGWIAGEVPLSRLYIFRGNYAPRQLTDVEASFNTMRPSQFAADSYATGWLELKPRLPWLGIGRWRPQFTLSIGAAWGMVSDQTEQLHQGQVPGAPELGFFEPGLSLRNLFPAPRKDTLLRTFIKALGVGLYYNAGRYNNPFLQENLAVRVGFRL